MPSITPTIFLLIFFAGVAAALFIDPSYGIYTYIITYFINPRHRWWWWEIPHLRYFLIISLVTLVAYLIRYEKYSNINIFDIPQTKWLFIFGLLVVLMFPFAVVPWAHQKYGLLFLKYIIFYFLILKTIDTPKKIERVFFVFLLGQFYLSWLAYQGGRTGQGRLENLGGPDSLDANSSAAVLVIAIPILINYIINGKNWERFFSVGILAFVLNAVVLVNSRGSFVALVASSSYLLYYFLSSPSITISKKSYIIAGMAGCIFLFVYLTDALFWERMTSLGDTSVEGSGGRIRFWLITFDMLKDHPFGLGALGYQAKSLEYFPQELLRAGGKARAVHSLFFQILAEYGYLGFVIYIMFILSSFRYMKKIGKAFIRRNLYAPFFYEISLEAALLSFYITALFISVLYMEIIYWFTALTGAYGLIYTKKMKEIIRAGLK